MPSVSVIVPTYNCENYIVESLQSIISQSMPPVEIIVIDDGSTDATESVVASLDDPRVKYFKKANGGISSARNLGLSIATGDYVAFLDADDRWLPSMLEVQLGIMEADRSLVASFVNFVRFDHFSGQRLPDQFQFYSEIFDLSSEQISGTQANRICGNSFSALVAFGEVPAYLQCVIFRRAMIEGITFHLHIRRCQDLDFFLRAVARGGVAFSNQVLAEIRRHGNNITADTSLMSVDKLEALHAVRSASLTKGQSLALEERIARANVDAAVARIKSGRVARGLWRYLLSLPDGRGPWRKLRGLARVLITLAGL